MLRNFKEEEEEEEECPPPLCLGYDDDGGDRLRSSTPPSAPRSASFAALAITFATEKSSHKARKSI